MPTTSHFPLVDALLTTPPEGAKGAVAVCTNTTAPGQVVNEIEQNARKSVAVLGSLIVSRDGTERMILNSLAHPTLKYLVLFSEESLTFSPSTNLLLALMHGLDEEKKGNYIKNGVAASAHFPNLSKKILDAFRENILVLPLFMFKNDRSQSIIAEYLEWLKSKVDETVYELLKDANEKREIYYDSLNALLKLLAELPGNEKIAIELDPKEFQHLQPPKIELPDLRTSFSVPFRVTREGEDARLDIEVGGDTFVLKGRDAFDMSYALMSALGNRRYDISPRDQLLLGAELARVLLEISSGIEEKPFVEEEKVTSKKEIKLASNFTLKPDEAYYYKVGVKEPQVSVMCMAFDVCEEVFDLRSKSFAALIEKLAELDRFQKYEMDMLHRLDVGAQIGRAAIALRRGYAFIQDFSLIFEINTKTLPLLTADSDSFLDVHKRVIQGIYTKGLTEEHGDAHKGLTRTAVALAVYRNSKKALARLPNFYKQGETSTDEMRRAYKKQLLRFDHDGDYSYGERTRAFFGFDQLEKTIEILKKNPERATIVQRYDPARDMGMRRDPDTGEMKYTHDPCLTHDIYIPRGKTLHSFHIARAHNTVNAYPENIFGLHDAYVATIRKKTGLASGDMYMLSSRANILLLTEEQRSKAIIAEPSKPPGKIDAASGPHRLGENVKSPARGGVVAFRAVPLKSLKRLKHKTIERLRDFGGVDTIERAITYLKTKGVMHNNPVLTEYQAGESDPQGDCLAYFQANIFGGRVYATAVFMNHPLKKQKEDIALCTHLATLFGEALKAPLGELSLFYVAYT